MIPFFLAVWSTGEGVKLIEDYFYRMIMSMSQKSLKDFFCWKEIIVMVGIAFAFFLGSAFHRDGVRIDWWRLPFLANYVLCSCIICYLFLPLFFYKGRSILFFALSALAVIIAILIEELILEKIFFPDTRGMVFTGVFFNFIRMLPMIMIFVGFKFAWDAVQQRREIASLQSTVVSSQLDFLKSQIHPHFLFNSLNNLYSFALESSKRTPEIILQLSSILRYMLYDCKSERVQLSEEVKFLDDFVRLHELQIEGRGKVSFSVEGDTSNKNIAPLIFVPFIENAFKHSANSMSDDIDISISLHIMSSDLHFICRNVYSEQAVVADSAKGIGLQNIVKRLDLMYPSRYELNITSEDKVYLVDLKLSVA